MNTNSHIENVFNNMLNDVSYIKWSSYIVGKSREQV